MFGRVKSHGSWSLGWCATKQDFKPQPTGPQNPHALHPVCHVQKIGGATREAKRSKVGRTPDFRGSRRQRPRVRAGVVGRDVNTGTEVVPRSPGE